MKRTLHLATRERQPPWLADTDWVVYLPERKLAPHGAPPVLPGTIRYEQLLDLIFAADHVVAW